MSLNFVNFFVLLDCIPRHLFSEILYLVVGLFDFFYSFRKDLHKIVLLGFNHPLALLEDVKFDVIDLFKDENALGSWFSKNFSQYEFELVDHIVNFSESFVLFEFTPVLLNFIEGYVAYNAFNQFLQR